MERVKESSRSFKGVGSEYLSPEETFSIEKRGTKKSFAVVGSLIAAILIFLGSFISFDVSEKFESYSGDAAWLGFLCTRDTVGHNMKSTLNLHRLSVIPLMDKGNRTWTLEEAYGGNLGFVNYYGETGSESAGWFLADTDDPDSDESRVPDFLEGNMDDLVAVRSVPGCTIDNFPLMIASFLFMLASAIMNFITIFVTNAFDVSFICKEAGDTNCVDMVKVIGGTGSSDGGIIGALTSNIYIPLAVIAITIGAFSILYQGIVKRQFRKAFGYLAWILLSFILGLMMLVNPNGLARAPMTVSSGLAACVIGAFNGESCFSDSSSTTELDFDPSEGDGTSGKICTSNAATSSPSEKLSMTINGMTCSIWKAFILQPHTAAEFGVPFEDLDVHSSELMTSMIAESGLPEGGEEFCVDRFTAESFNEATSSSPIRFTEGGGGKVCNVAAYQMYLQTKATSGGDTEEDLKARPDTRWYNVVGVVVQDPDMWNTWVPDLGGGFTRIGMSFVALISVILGGILLTVTSIYAMVYYIGSIILMALAPLFLLIGLQPTRGKKIFLGWVEKLVSNVLKYFASAFFLIIALAFYSAILGNMTNPFTTLVFVFVLTVALFMYRKEIVDLLGRVNMGGTQMSNRFAGMADKGKRMAKVGLGSAIGQAHDQRSVDPRVAMAGAGRGLTRELSQGTGVIANAAKQVNRGRAAREREASRGIEETSKSARHRQQELSDSQKEHELNVQDASKDIESMEGEQEDLRTKIDAEIDTIAADVEQDVRLRFTADNPDFGEYLNIGDQIDTLQSRRDDAYARGDEASAARYNTEIRSLEEEARELNVSPEEIEDYQDAINDGVQVGVKNEMRNNAEFASNVQTHNDLTNEIVAREQSVQDSREAIEGIKKEKVENGKLIDRIGKLEAKKERGGYVRPEDIQKAKKRSKKRNPVEKIGDIRRGPEESVVDDIEDAPAHTPVDPLKQKKFESSEAEAVDRARRERERKKGQAYDDLVEQSESGDEKADFALDYRGDDDADKRFATRSRTTSTEDTASRSEPSTPASAQERVSSSSQSRPARETTSRSEPSTPASAQERASSNSQSRPTPETTSRSEPITPSSTQQTSSSSRSRSSRRDTSQGGDDDPKSGGESGNPFPKRSEVGGGGSSRSTQRSSNRSSRPESEYFSTPSESASTSPKPSSGLRRIAEQADQVLNPHMKSDFEGLFKEDNVFTQDAVYKFQDEINALRASGGASPEELRVLYAALDHHIIHMDR